MDLFNFGREQLQNGSLNTMLQQVGVDDVGSFVNQFRDQASTEAQHTQPSSRSESNDFLSMGSSMLNQFSGGGGGGEQHSGNSSANMIQGAMKAYKMFSGNQTGGSGGGGGSFLDNIGSTYQSAKQAHDLYKQFDKNGDGKITAEDIQIYLQEMGLGAVSPYLSKALFRAVDQNHNGTLDFTDLMALSALLSKLTGRFGGGSVAQ